MSVVRPFVAADIPQVADLHRRIFRTVGPDAAGWEDAYRRYFSEVFLRRPNGDNTIASLVCEDRSGRVVGFLGIEPRRMMFRGRPVLMAVCSQFVVDPSSRGQVGLRMVRHCLAGPQDLSITDEAEYSTQRIWQWCGGVVAHLHSMYWIRPLRPARTVLAVLGKRMRLARTAVAAPVARMMDALVTRLARGPLHVPQPRGAREDLDVAMIPAVLPDLMRDRALRPDYDDQSVRWILDRAGRLNGHGELRAVLVRDDAQDAAGWFVYYANPGRIAEVLQIAAKPPAVPVVLDHLLHDASRRDVVALAGRLDPPFIRELSERYFLLHRRGFATCVHAKRPEVMDTIHRGDAFLSRLDGEWCLRFQ